MASYRLSAKVFKGKNGGTVVSRAAYRAGEKLKNERTGQTFDYTDKAGVVHAELMFPDNAKEVPREREAFWNAVEAFELGKRKDAQLAREIVISLPHELSADERKKLARSFVKENFVKQGMVADLCIHAPQASEGDDRRNHHAHIMLTMRKVGWGGFDPVKTRKWNTADQLKTWRTNWADLQNAHLAQGGHQDRVDHRTLAEQAKEARKLGQREKAVLLEREPEIHVGPEARQIGDGGKDIPSQTRKVPRYGKGREEGAFRNVYYPEFDRGSRAAYNQRIIERNATQATWVLDKQLERQARLLARQQYYQSQQRKWETEERERQRRLSEKQQVKSDILQAIDHRHRYGKEFDQRFALLENRIDWYAQSVRTFTQGESGTFSDRQHAETMLYDLLNQRRALVETAKAIKSRGRAFEGGQRDAKKRQAAFAEKLIATTLHVRKRKTQLDARLAFLRQRITQVGQTIRLLRKPHQRALRRQQQYQLKYFLRERKQVIVARQQQQAAQKQTGQRRTHRRP